MLSKLNKLILFNKALFIKPTVDHKVLYDIKTSFIQFHRRLLLKQLKLSKISLLLFFKFQPINLLFSQRKFYKKPFYVISKLFNKFDEQFTYYNPELLLMSKLYILLYLHNKSCKKLLLQVTIVVN